jgi:ATP-dependent exoDNAse (exonuclease V) beta subunit
LKYIKIFVLEIVLSTAHKAKGLEFPIVILADDFLPRPNDVSLDKISLDKHRENLNILYVAATRATKELVLNMDLFYLLYKMCRVR